MLNMIEARVRRGGARGQGARGERSVGGLGRKKGVGEDLGENWGNQQERQEHEKEIAKRKKGPRERSKRRWENGKEEEGGGVRGRYELSRPAAPASTSSSNSKQQRQRQ
jgi:hypothetical protein